MKKSKQEKLAHFIRSSNHPFPLINPGKEENLDSLLSECRRVSQQMLDFLWTNEIEWDGKFFDIQNDQLNVPSMLSTVNLPTETDLSARVQKCLVTQVLGIIRAVTEIRRKRLFVLDQLKAEGRDSQNLREKLEKPLKKPEIPENGL